MAELGGAEGVAVPTATASAVCGVRPHCSMCLSRGAVGGMLCTFLGIYAVYTA